MKKKFKITGMSCAACQAHVNKAVSKLKVNECNVNLISNTMEVDYDESKLSEKDIINAVIKEGYGASLLDENYIDNTSKTVDKKKRNLIISIILLIVLMYFSMGSMINLPSFIQNAGLINVIIQVILSSIIIGFNFHYYTSGFKKLIKLSPNMDSLVALGSSASYLYGIYNFIRMIIALINKDLDNAHHYSMNLYFESAAMIVTLVSVGKYLEGLSKKQTSLAIEELVGLLPKVVIKKVENELIETKLEDVQVGDLIYLKPYEFVALDGVIIEGESFFDESSITGESKLVHKKESDTLISGSVNGSQGITYKVNKKASDSTISKIIEMVEEASNSKMPLARIADKVALYFVPIVMAISLIAFIIWMIIKNDFTFALDIAISILVISCPCALGLATPLVVMIATGIGAKNHILIKGAESLENLHNIDTIVIDKTGTITKGKMEVIDKVEYVNDSLSILASIEKHSDHPLGYSLKDIANNDLEIMNIENHIGKGISGIYNNERYYVGSIKFIKEVCKEEINIDILNLEKEGKNVVLISTSNKIQALVTLKDQVKESSLLALSLFKKEGIEVIMATGDNIDIASLVAKEVGIDRFKANCMPLDKKELIDELHKENKKVLMIGDGINDAVSLASSDVSIAVDSKVDVAKNTSDIVLVEPDLLVAYNAYYLSKKTVRNIKINLFWAFFYNIIAIPLASGVFYESLGIKLSPMLGALCMSLSSLCVCLNALRLKNIKWKEIKNMKLEFYVDDMMCMHCVSRIKEALSVKGIENINIDLDSKLVSVETSLKKEAVFKLIKKAKYKVREK